MANLLDWLDDRTGYRALVRGVLYERIPGGARWRYVWGSTLTFAILVQFVTGVVLWAAYSANAQGAWESVYYIQNVMQGGWLLATAVGNKLLFIGSFFWDRIQLWQLWGIFVITCLLSAAFIFSILKRLERATQ